MIDLHTCDLTATGSVQFNVEQDEAYVLGEAGRPDLFGVCGIETGSRAREVGKMADAPVSTDIEDGFDGCARPVFDLDRGDLERFLEPSSADRGESEIRTAEGPGTSCAAGGGVLKDVSSWIDVEVPQELAIVEALRQGFVKFEFRVVRLGELEAVAIKFGETSRRQPVDRVLDFRFAQGGIQAAGEVADQGGKIAAGIGCRPGAYLLNQIRIHAIPLTQYAGILLAQNAGVERYLV